nr:neuromedin-K receptor-like [Halyomorpha halys]
MAVALSVTYVDEHDHAGRIYKKPFCNNTRLSNNGMMAYRMILVSVQYLTPLCVISYAYARMALRLWGSRAPGNAQHSRDANLMRNKKKVIKMLVIVVALFAICWLPLQTYNVLQDIFPQINGYRYINIIWFCCDWLAMSNSCYNPFIYGIYNEKFKIEFKQRCPFRQSRRWRPSFGGDSMDLDKTLHRYGSMHQPTRWVRYSSRRRSTFSPSQHYVYHCANSNVVHHHSSHTDIEELCL